MRLKDLVAMDMGEAVDWLVENQDDYKLVKKEDTDHCCKCKLYEDESILANFCYHCGRELKSAKD